MKYQDLFELRRNPEQNPKVAGHAQAVEFLSTLGDFELQHWGISMTMINKLGINPSSSWGNTPLGVYFYPASYYLEMKQRKGWSLPFMDKARFIQVFEYDISTRLDLVNYKNYKKDLEVLKKHVKEVITVNAGPATAIIKQTYKTADAMMDPNNKYRNGVDLSVKQIPINMNKLFREMGYTSIIDPGLSIIHPSEPYQGVILDPRSIKQVKSIPNISPIEATITPDTLSNQHSKEYRELFNRAITTRKRNKMLEPTILKNESDTFQYVRYVLKAPWPEAEKVLSSDPTSTYWLDRYKAIISS